MRAVRRRRAAGGAAAHIPVHLGSTPLSVQAVIEREALADGEVAIVNDPYAGGTTRPT